MTIDNIETDAMERLSQLTVDDFEAVTDRAFLVTALGAEVTIPFELRTIRVFGSGVSRTAFALDFLGPTTAPLDQGTYLFSHATIGRFALFLVPVGLDAMGRQYEAIFNRSDAPAIRSGEQ